MCKAPSSRWRKWGCEAPRTKMMVYGTRITAGYRCDRRFERRARISAWDCASIAAGFAGGGFRRRPRAFPSQERVAAYIDSRRFASGGSRSRSRSDRTWEDLHRTSGFSFAAPARPHARPARPSGKQSSSRYRSAISHRGAGLRAARHRRNSIRHARWRFRWLVRSEKSRRNYNRARSAWRSFSGYAA